MIGYPLGILFFQTHPDHRQQGGEGQRNQEGRKTVAEDLNLGHKEDHESREDELRDIQPGKTDNLLPRNFAHLVYGLRLMKPDLAHYKPVMQELSFTLAISLLVISCSPDQTTYENPAQNSSGIPRLQKDLARNYPAGVTLNGAQRKSVGMKIWQNESGGKISGLTHWNEGEEFPSLGIGHFIWYPARFNGRWTETWPEFVKFAQNKGVRGIPSPALLPDCPWNNRVVFQRDFNGKALTALRSWLVSNIDVQTEFIMAKSRAALPQIMAAAPASQRTRIEANYGKVGSTPNGIYALIDYVNFKGDGTNPRERYKGQGWGLMWVLAEMRPVPRGQAAAREFAAAAKRCLDRRVQNSPPDRGEQRWTAGWHNRCNTYAAPF